ncbi:sarcosine oxidase subunit gamma [Alphaproteobacteria bacterium LSUCC0684]
MAKTVSALHGHMKKGRYGASGTPGVIIEEVRVATLVQLAAWPETHSEAGKLAARMAGVRAAPGRGKVKRSKKGELLSIDPLKWWVISDHEEISAPSVPVKTGMVLDLSDARTWLRIRGAKAEMLLNHFLPLDFRKDVFSEDDVASTGFHHIGVTVWRAKDGFNLLLPRSFALSLWELLETSAHQYGLEVK